MSITLQPWKLKLLSIPKAYPKSISSCTHAIVKNIFFPRSRDCLFSFTQNALELAVVADVNVVAQDFLSLNLEGLMVTDDVFCAFMVDDPDGIGNSGRRINELSALLSRNGISIFYISTHVTDFILVKEKRLRLHSESDSSSMDGVGFGTSLNTMSTSVSQSHLASRGQQGRQPSLAESSFGDGIGRYFPKRHPIGSSAESFDNVGDESIPAPSVSDNNLHTAYRINTSVSRDGTIRGSGDGEVTTPMTPMTPSANSLPGFGFFPSLGLMHETLEEQEEREADTKDKIRRSCPRSVIDDKLILTGLSLDYQAQWAVTLLKVLFYPEELPGYSGEKRSRFMSFTTTDEGTSLIVDQEVLGYFEEHMLNMSLSQTALRCIQVDLSTFGLDTYGLVYSMCQMQI
ncbi:hypothetical protein BGZ82_006952 [Podila clonocystis]|nr:hypothetical protein BGZ82_006952 [Podila clonocystis]